MTAPLLELAHHLVQQMRDGFTRPDDDWLATLLIERADGERAVIALANGADSLTVQAVITHAEAVRAVLVTSTWVSMRHADDLPMVLSNPMLRPSLDPHREEWLVIHYVSRDEFRTEMAPIVRSKLFPPKLGGFDVTEGLDVVGSMSDAMRRGIG